MLSEPATVVDASPDGLVLQSGRSTSCSGCSLKAGCGHHLLSAPEERLYLSRSDITNADELGRLCPGSQVDLQVAASDILGLTACFYLLPLSGLLLGTLVAVWSGLGEPGTALAALTGLLAGFGGARAGLRRRQQRFSIGVAPQRFTSKEIRS